MTDPRTLVLSWLSGFTRGRPSDSVVTIPVSELIDLEERLRDAPGKVSRSRKPKGMTSRSKQRRKQDTAYLAFVRSQPCCDCGARYGVEAHHTGGKADKAMGRKPPDNLAVPLCRRCHQHFHDKGHFISSGKYNEVLSTDEVVRRTREELQAKWAERNNQGEEF